MYGYMAVFQTGEVLTWYPPQTFSHVNKVFKYHGNNSLYGDTVYGELYAFSAGKKNSYRFVRATGMYNEGRYDEGGYKVYDDIDMLWLIDEIMKKEFAKHEV